MVGQIVAHAADAAVERGDIVVAVEQHGVFEVDYAGLLQSAGLPQISEECFFCFVIICFADRDLDLRYRICSCLDAVCSGEVGRDDEFPAPHLRNISEVHDKAGVALEEKAVQLIREIREFAVSPVALAVRSVKQDQAAVFFKIHDPLTEGYA